MNLGDKFQDGSYRSHMVTIIWVANMYLRLQLSGWHLSGDICRILSVWILSVGWHMSTHNFIFY